MHAHKVNHNQKRANTELVLLANFSMGFKQKIISLSTDIQNGWLQNAIKSIKFRLCLLQINMCVCDVVWTRCVICCCCCCFGYCLSCPLVRCDFNVFIYELFWNVAHGRFWLLAQFTILFYFIYLFISWRKKSEELTKIPNKNFKLKQIWTLLLCNQTQMNI